MSRSASPVQLVPGDRECLAEEAEGDGPLDGFLDAVAGLADAVGFALLEAGLDRPAGCVAGNQPRRGCLDIGGGDRDVVAVATLRIADQQQLDGPVVERAVPQAGKLGDVLGALTSVGAGDRHGIELQRVSELGQRRQPLALQRRAAAFGSRRRRLIARRWSASWL